MISFSDNFKQALGMDKEAPVEEPSTDDGNIAMLFQLEQAGVDLTPLEQSGGLDKILLASNRRTTTTTKKDWAEGLSTQTAVGLYEAGVAPDEDAQAAYDARKADVAAKKGAKDKNLRPANAEVSDGPKESALRAMLKKRGMTDAQIDAIIKTQAKDRGIHR